jgi:7-carboxy-7-deazaguanine synthase
MVVGEIYNLIQGEGKLTGKASILIRTIGCNLRCEWTDAEGHTTICDTPFASWHPEKGKNMTAEEILQECSKNPLIRYVIISGGEPFLQKDIKEVTNLLMEHNYHVTIETAGTLYIQGLRCNLLSVSPKLFNSYPKNYPERSIHFKGNERQFQNLSLLIKESGEGQDWQLKFVVNHSSDEVYIDDFLREYQKFVPSLAHSNDYIYLMPEGITSDELNKSAALCQQIAIRRGWNYSDRIHIRIYGSIRGV